MQDVKEGKDYSFPREEEEVLKYWDAIDAFKQQLKRSEGKPEYIFYDGPPFATGLPHYGHLLAGTLKVGLWVGCGGDGGLGAGAGARVGDALAGLKRGQGSGGSRAA